MPNYSRKIVYLSDAQRQELFTNNTITVNGQTITYNDNDIYVTPQAEPIIDVKINNTSISANGVANIPLATSSTPGLVKAYTAGGVSIFTSGTYAGCLYLPSPNDETIKAGVNGGLSLKPCDQHKATFYGLAKVAGADMKNSNNEIGTYTDEAKAAIQNMLGVTSLFANEEFSTATAVHGINSLFMMNGKLHKATTAIGIGNEVTAGLNCTVVNLADVLNTKVDNYDGVFLNSISLGRKANTTIGGKGYAIGEDVEASGFGSIATGYQTVANAQASHAEGYQTTASGPYSRAEGGFTTASSQASHAEGLHTTASGIYAHVEGSYCVSGGAASHAEGSYTTASGYASHAEGYETVSGGTATYAGGYGTIASANCSHVFGVNNIEDLWPFSPEWVANTSYEVGDLVKVTSTVDNVTTVMGYKCAVANSDSTFTSSNWNKNMARTFVEIVGNGVTGGRSNARTLDWNGNERLNGYLYVGCNADSTGGIRVPHDIQLNGVSIVSNGVANIPKAGYTDFGVVKVFDGYGIGMVSGGAADGAIGIACATDNLIKIGTSAYKAIVPAHQHESVFYGLAKAAGDTTMTSSSNAVGTYTQVAKTAIQTMLGIENGAVIVEEVAGTTPTITGIPNYRYKCGEVSTISITPPTSGSIDVRFNSGSTAAVMTVPSTVKWPEWFDAENLDTNTTYEILITDGVYGSVMTWA